MLRQQSETHAGGLLDRQQDGWIETSGNEHRNTSGVGSRRWVYRETFTVKFSTCAYISKRLNSQILGGRLGPGKQSALRRCWPSLPPQCYCHCRHSSRGGVQDGETAGRAGGVGGSFRLSPGRLQAARVCGQGDRGTQGAGSRARRLPSPCTPGTVCILRGGGSVCRSSI